MQKDMDEIGALIRGQPIFRVLPPAGQQELARVLRRRRVGRGEQIIVAGEPSVAAYFVAQGLVRIYRLSLTGREQALMDLGPGGMFNMVPVIDGRPGPSNALARADSVIYSIARDDFLALMRRYPALAEAVLLDFAGRLRQLTGLVEDLALRTVPQRLARALVAMTGEARPGAGRFTQQELANQLGTVREVVSRTLRRFEREGLIRMERHRIMILDPEGLAALAAEDEPEGGD